MKGRLGLDKGQGAVVAKGPFALLVVESCAVGVVGNV